MNLENYKPQYRHRLYYPNRCNLCFSKEKLMKCGSCLAVMYCSREHQIEDWPFHKPTCKAFKRIKQKVGPVPEKCDEVKFYRYRTALIYQLTKLRNLRDKYFLTTYEYQICTIPWVCLVCFVNPTNKFECTTCETVVYCSKEHMKIDKEEHKIYCLSWKLIRCCNSLPYEYGYRIKAKSHIYDRIKEHIRSWPSNKIELCDLIIQNGIKSGIASMESDDYINLNLFIDPYIPAAIIIHFLEKTSFIMRRHMMEQSKVFRKKYLDMSRKTQHVPFKKKSTLTIHFAIADDRELSFQWDKIAQLLTDWIKNINKVQIVLTGTSLAYCILPPFENQEKVEIKMYPKAYHQCENLPKPDVIILLECHRACLVDEKRKWLNLDFVNALFRHSKIPVILCDGRPEVIEEIYERLYDYSENLISPIWPNPFTGLNILRKWDYRMTTFVENEKCFVLMKG